jgi:hypothetical protein
MGMRTFLANRAAKVYRKARIGSRFEAKALPAICGLYGGGGIYVPEPGCLWLLAAGALAALRRRRAVKAPSARDRTREHHA